jgi:hypothetical protein
MDEATLKDTVIDEIEAIADTAAATNSNVPATTKTAALAAPPGHRLVDPLAHFAQQEGGLFFDGDFIQFSGQTGAWTRNKEPISPTVPFLCNLREIAVGWVKFGDGKIVDRHVGRVVDGYQRQPRDALPDRDERNWLTRNGVREDPWKSVTYLPMRSSEDGRSVAYGPWSDSGRRAIAAFVGVCQRTDRGRKDPLVLLESRSFRSQHGSVLYAPEFKIIGWDFWNGEPAPPILPIAVPLAPPTTETKALPANPGKGNGVDLDDEIPF